MNYLDIKKKFIHLSGRHDLVNGDLTTFVENTSIGPGVAWFINAGQKRLDDLVIHQHTYQKKELDLYKKTNIRTLADISGSLNNKYFFIFGGSNSYYVWFNVSSGGSDPAPAGYTGIAVAINTNDSASTVASAVQVALNSNANFTATVSNNRVSVVNVSTTDVSEASDYNTSFAIEDRTHNVDLTMLSESNLAQAVKLIQSVHYYNSQGGITKLDKITLDTWRSQYDESASRDNPNSYAPYITHIDYPELYDKTGIKLYPLPDKSYKLIITGSWYSPYISADTDTSFWSLSYPETLIKSALWALEEAYRNTEGAKDWEAAVRRDLVGIENNTAEEQAESNLIMEDSYDLW